jgi:hypothetical protein
MFCGALFVVLIEARPDFLQSLTFNWEGDCEVFPVLDPFLCHAGDWNLRPLFQESQVISFAAWWDRDAFLENGRGTKSPCAPSPGGVNEPDTALITCIANFVEGPSTCHAWFEWIAGSISNCVVTRRGTAFALNRRVRGCT